jgi:hypothetical protein
VSQCSLHNRKEIFLTITYAVPKDDRRFKKNNKYQSQFLVTCTVENISTKIGQSFLSGLL